MTCPVGVYDHFTCNKAFEVTVRDACWKCKSQEVSKADALQSNAQFLFFCTVAAYLRAAWRWWCTYDDREGASWSICKPQPSEKVACSCCCPHYYLTSSLVHRAVWPSLITFYSKISSRTKKVSWVAYSSICTLNAFLQLLCSFNDNPETGIGNPWNNLMDTSPTLVSK